MSHEELGSSYPGRWYGEIWGIDPVHVLNSTEITEYY